MIQDVLVASLVVRLGLARLLSLRNGEVLGLSSIAYLSTNRLGHAKTGHSSTYVGKRGNK